MRGTRGKLLQVGVFLKNTCESLARRLRSSMITPLPPFKFGASCVARVFPDVGPCDSLPGGLKDFQDVCVHFRPMICLVPHIMRRARRCERAPWLIKAPLWSL